MAKTLVVIPLGLIAVAALLMIASMLGLLTLQKAVEAAELDALSLPTLYSIDGVEVTVNGDHGLARHGAEYLAAVSVCQTSHRKAWFLEPNKTTLHVLCEGSDGWYDLVMEFERGLNHLWEKTGFKRASNWQDAAAAMQRKGATPIKLETVLKMLGVIQ